MTRYTLLIALFCWLAIPINAQVKMNDYTEYWKKVNNLMEKQYLPESALKEVEKIYALAKKDKNDAEQIKALVYMGQLMESNVEDNGEKYIQILEKEIKTARQPALSLLYSLKATAYWEYLQENRWELYQLTKTLDKGYDINTWTSADLHSEITKNYLASLKDKKALELAKLNTFEPIIIKGNQRKLRPTLYDLTAHTALAYFTNDERDLQKHAASFEINEAAAFSTADIFAKHHFDIDDSSSLFAQALLLYQDLTRFHLSDQNPEALIDLDLARLQFVYEHAMIDNKTDLYLESLTKIRDRYTSNPASAQAAFLKASKELEIARVEGGYKEKGNSRDALPKIKKDCEQIVLQFSDSEGGLNCKRLLQELDKKELSLEMEKVNLPNQPMRCLVGFKNIPAVYYRIIQVTDTIEANLTDRWNSKYWSFLKAQKFLKENKQILPLTVDSRNHSTEIKIDGLAPGKYILLASGDQNFSINKNPLSAQYFYVSQIAYISRGNDYFVLNRESGRPLQHADISVWTQTYDYSKRKYELIKRTSLKSNLDGFVKLPVVGKNNEQVRLEISIKGDHLFLDDTEYRSYSVNNEEIDNKQEYEENQRKLFLFTDRSIYRPGQTVYFKGIIITRDFDTKKFKVLPDYNSKIELTDENGETIDSLDVKAGEFGTFSGSFKLPENGFTGEFSIEDTAADGSASFSVEEYKRPTFYIDYKTPEHEYRLNDTVTSKGLALGYAGNSMDGAKVKYRVTRISRFPFPWLYRGYGFSRSEPMEITQGETKTNPDGSFHIRFKAIPDKSIDKNILPVFEYEVSADITDISGETRSASTIVSIGYHALVLGLGLPADKILQNDKNQAIGISASNLSGVPQTVQAHMAVYPLNGPQRLIRQRYWNKPDTFVMNEKEYLQHFPFDEYADETKKENWQRGKTVFEKTDSIKGDQYKLNLPVTALSPGWYILEVKATDSYGQAVNAIEYFQVMDIKSGLSNKYGYFSNRLTNPVVQPGDITKLQINTQADDLWVIQLTDGYKNQADKKTPAGKISRPKDAIAYEDPEYAYRFYNLNKESKEFTYLVSEEDRGGFGVSHAFVKHNRFFTTNDIISVPWKNKELDISFTTYRDKTLPGSKEEWTVNIKGNKGDKVAAEILASMYDASLDQFRYHQWQKPTIYENYPTRDGKYLLVPWTSPNSFLSVSSQNWRYPEPDIKMFVKNYDALIWEGQYGINILSDSRRELSLAAAPVADSNSQMLQGKAAGVEMNREEDELNDVVVGGYGVQRKKEISDSIATSPSGVQIRKNFNETAFFFPQLKTDQQGNVTFTFTIPEAMTQWKWQVLAHTKELSFGLATKSIITQKELMVQPNAPRFLREGDQLVFPARISNLTDKEISGQAQLQVIDAESGRVVDGLFSNIFPTQYFTVPAKQGTLVNFNLTIPGNYSKPVIYRIIAKAGDHSDGEEKALPILSNRILLTESMPMQLRGTGSKVFSFEKLLQSASSPSLTHHKLTIEYSSNPAWLAVQSLPYLTTYPYDCAEQVFNRFYANAIAAKIVASTPKIKAYYEQWLRDSANGKSGALVSNLSKNEELKSILLEETPWVMEGKNETEQKRNIAVLFDLARLSSEMDAALAKLQEAQSPNGGFVWFSGGPDDRYITQYIIAGLGKLKKAGAIPEAYKKITDRITLSSLDYLNKRIKEDYDYLVKIKAKLNDPQINSLQIQYLYALSFHLDQPMEGAYLKAITYYHKQAQQFWQKQSPQLQAMTALVLFRSKDGSTSKAIINSLRERAIKNETLGMYWKNTQPAYFWQDAPIETQALLIEAFTEVSQDEVAVSSMKQWLLTQKQTNSWPSTKATADACYALLMKGSNWLDAERNTYIKVGNIKPIVFSNEKDTEAGSGYVKSVIDGTQVQPEMGKIEVTIKGPANKENESISWGAAYWQYFENLDQVKASTSPLNLVKKIYIEKNTDKGPLLVPVAEGESYKVGDKLKVRIELRSDRDMEYVHLRDMRPSGSEPVNVLSGYKWQGTLGYYESTKDAATHFFFSRITKGSHIFEYPLFVTHEGKFSVGVATVECMYAPEFRAHSEGLTIKFNREGAK